MTDDAKLEPCEHAELLEHDEDGLICEACRLGTAGTARRR